jgi:ribosome-interacting GTPase 1
MPTNLPPEYFAVEKRYKAAQTPEERVELLEELISTIPKHKGTDKLRADLRERLSKLRLAAQTHKKASRQASAFHIDKEGAGQVAIIGAPNVGKSSLVAYLTNADPQVSEAPFTTWTPTPGMMVMDNIQVQLIDTPPLDKDYIEPEMANLLHQADLLVLVVDVQSDPLSQLEESLELLAQSAIYPFQAQVPPGVHKRVYLKPLLVLVNKCDEPEDEDDWQVFCELTGSDYRCLPFSTRHERNVEAFKRAVYEELGIIRIYAKPPGKPADLQAPFVMKKGSTIADLALKVHRDFAENLKSARIWGSGAFDGQPVGKEYVLQDGDIVELRV